MSKKLLAVVLLALLSWTVCCTAETCPPAVQQPTAEMIQDGLHNARDHGFLWRISKNGRTSYLYGTIHVAKFDWMFPGPQVMQAIRSTDTVALEMDMLDAGIQQDMSRRMAEMQSKALPASLQKRIRQQADAFCVPYDSIAKLSPEFQVVALTMMVGRKAGLEAGYAIDAVLAGIGHKAKKNMVSLESPELQMQALHMHDESEMQAFVADSLDELEANRSLTMLDSIAKHWADADYAEMERFNEWCDCLNTEIERLMMKRLLDERNPELAAKIDALHTGGKQVFAAVGSLHMFGPLGLPKLLEKRGYQIEQVKLK
jgi:uncharacterized protein